MSADFPVVVPTIDASTVERVLLHGDLAKLTPTQKVSYYRAVCESVGLNPLTQPFQYLVLSGREVLYARREATEQLRQIHQVSIVIAARELVEGMYVVTARATLPTGRTDENIGVVPLGDLKGEARANAMMKAETKSKRRVTLAICGLGMLDESEVADLPPGAALPPPEPAPAAAMGEYATVEAPPPGDEDLRRPVPEGYVTVLRIDSSPTKNDKVTKYFVTLSNGVRATTINQWLATLAQECCEQQTPVRAVTQETRWGPELKSLKADPPDPPPPSLPLTADEIPF